MTKLWKLRQLGAHIIMGLSVLCFFGAFLAIALQNSEWMVYFGLATLVGAILIYLHDKLDNWLIKANNKTTPC